MDIGVLSEGETMSAALAADGFRRLNNMMGSWMRQSLTMRYIAREEFATVNGQGGPSAPYTIGTGGNFNTDRPASQSSIVGAGLLLGNSSPVVEIPRAVLTNDAYEAIQVKTLTSTLWTDVYYRPTFPLGSIFLWPVPNTSANSLVLYTQKMLSTFATLTTSYDLAPGTEEAIEYNLAVRLSTPYGRELPNAIAALAVQSLSILKRANTPMTDMPVDPALTHNNKYSYNIVSGSGGGN